jgi:eukaryotic-like serine/threonine-protein kinase
MGEVYRARDPRLGREVAIKVIPEAVARDLVTLARFEREARSVAALSHPNILAIHDFAKQGDVSFAVMELLEGESLGERIARSRLSWRKAVEIGVAIADGLAAAHSKGIIHRDLKPANAFVTSDGRVKILDFGIARVVPARADSDTSVPTDARATEPGTIVGTVGYMSPEQIRGLPADARSDIFSFGCVLYEMLAGRRAFARDTSAETLTAILREEPPPLSPSAETFGELERIVSHCLEKSPEERFQSARDLAFHLRETLAASTAARPKRRPLPRRASRIAWLSGAALLVLGTAAFFAWRARRSPTSGEPLRAVALTTFSGVERYPSLSPDGDEVAFIWNGPKADNEDVYVQRIGSGSPLRLTTDPASDVNPVWSPDDRWIAFLRGNSAGPMSRSRYELVLVPPLGGPERRVAEVRIREVEWPSQAHLAWCPDASCLVVTDSPGEEKPDALFVVSVETGEKRQLTRPQPTVLVDTSPAVSPDGRALVFRRTVSYSIGELYGLALADGMSAAGEPERRTTAAFNADHPAWLPGGKEILVSARGGLWRLSLSGDDAPARLPFVGEDGLLPSVSHPRPGKRSRLVYARSFIDGNIWRIDVPNPGAAAPSPPAVAISSTRSEVHPNFSPDGRRVAFTSTRSGPWEIWISDPDGGNAVKLTSMDANATGGPSWSPDGRWIVFGSDQPGQFDLYVISASGGKPRRLTSHPAFDQSAIFSRDGRWIYFTSNRTGNFQIWKMPATGGDAIQITRNGGWIVSEAPDGAHLYYIDIPMTPKPVWRVPVAGGEPVKVVDGVVGWFFQAAEKGIYYAEQPAGQTRLMFYDFATGRSTTIAGNLGQIEFTPGVSPDGRTILYSRVDSTVDDLMLVENFR